MGIRTGVPEPKPRVPYGYNRNLAPSCSRTAWRMQQDDVDRANWTVTREIPAKTAVHAGDKNSRPAVSVPIYASSAPLTATRYREHVAAPTQARKTVLCVEGPLEYKSVSPFANLTGERNGDVEEEDDDERNSSTTEVDDDGEEEFDDDDDEVVELELSGVELADVEKEDERNDDFFDENLPFLKAHKSLNETAAR